MKCAWKGCPDDAPEGGAYCAAHLPGDPRNWKKRAADRGAWCWFAQRFSEAWDFIDKRDIDKHVVAWIVLYVTVYLLDWTLDYIYAHPDKSGVDLGLVVAAYMVPWSAVQAAVIKWYFEARS